MIANSPVPKESTRRFQHIPKINMNSALPNLLHNHNASVNQLNGGQVNKVQKRSLCEDVEDRNVERRPRGELLPQPVLNFPLPFPILFIQQHCGVVTLGLTSCCRSLLNMTPLSDLVFFALIFRELVEIHEGICGSKDNVADKPPMNVNYFRQPIALV